MVPDLLFEGLNTLEDEDKDVCFLNPDNFAEQARKRNNMPVECQHIYKNWSAFEEPLAKIQSKLTKGKSKFFRLSMMLGSSMDPKDLLGRCVMDWDNTQKNGGKVKITYKQMQVLRTSKKIILVGVPTDVDLESLGCTFRATMEEACITMVNKNPLKFGAIDKHPGLPFQWTLLRTHHAQSAQTTTKSRSGQKCPGIWNVANQTKGTSKPSCPICTDQARWLAY